MSRNGISSPAVRRFRYIQRLYECFLSLLLAWMFIWLNRTRGFGHAGGIFDEMGHIKIFPYWERSRILSYLYWHRVINENGLVLEQVIWSFFLASMIFLALRAFARINFKIRILQTIGGVLVVFGFPFFYVSDLFFFSRGLALITDRITNLPLLVFLELTLVGAGATVYYFQSRRITPCWPVTLLALHCLLWAWLTHNDVNPLTLIRNYEMQGYHIFSPGLWISATFYYGFPAISFLASVFWALFLRKPSEGGGQAGGPGS